MTFIGPDPEHLGTFGDKLSAKAAAKEAGLPLIPGSEGSIADVEEAVSVAQEIGFPIMLKAAFGGGGKGMRIVEDADVRTFFKSPEHPVSQELMRATILERKQAAEWSEQTGTVGADRS
jgi:pyruvate carboxylase